MRNKNKKFRVGPEEQYGTRMADSNLQVLVNLAIYTELISECLFVDSLLGSNNVITGVSE